jgi:hypothetical protein
MNDTTTPREKILAKLEKLVALAGSSEQAEANSAMETAIRIATENNIELSHLSRESRPKNEMKKEEVGKGAARLPVTHLFITDILKNFFEISVITGGNRDQGRKVWFIGKQENIDFAKFLYSYLENTFFRLWYNYYAKNPHAKNARESYFLGLWQGLTAKLKEAKAKIEQALEAQVKTSYSLMLVDNKAALDNAITEFFPILRNTKGKSIAIKNSAALTDGIEKGKQINVHGGLMAGKPVSGFIQ